MKLRKTWIECAGKNYGAMIMNAPVRIQQRFYKKFMSIPDEFRDQATATGVEWWNKKAIKGPGVDW